MGFSIDLGNWNSVFAVPSSVVDKHIKLANVTQIKTLLWILRHCGENFNISDIAKALSKKPDDIEDSLQYWIENKLIHKIDDKFKPALTEHEVKEDKKDNIKPSDISGDLKEDNIKNYSIPSRPQKPDAIFLADRIKQSEEIAYLMEQSQVILGKPISTGDSATLLMIHDTFGLPVDVIFMLIQYCVEINKPNLRYIEKLGIAWADEQIDTVEKADAKIKVLTQTNEAYYKVEKITGIEHHSPTASELNFSNRWVNEWKFSDDMIREAYERCVNQINKFTFKYTNGILKNWYELGIKTTAQAKIENETRKTKRNSEVNNVSYDIDKFENITFKKNLK